MIKCIEEETPEIVWNLLPVRFPFKDNKVLSICLQNFGNQSIPKILRGDLHAEIPNFFFCITFNESFFSQWGGKSRETVGDHGKQVSE